MDNTQHMAERPYSQERMEIINEQSMLTGFYTHSSGKNEKFKAHARKPDAKEEIMILVCILKKGLKILSSHAQNQSCPTAAQTIDKVFLEMDTSLDNFKKKFVRVYCGKNNICCFSKMLRELVIVRCKFTDEIKRMYCVYKGKIDIINCVTATFRTLENKICVIMSRVNESEDCDQSCYKEETTGVFSKCRNECTNDREINVNCCGSRRENSLCKIDGNKATEVRQDCKPPVSYCSVGINVNKLEPKPTFDLTLDYCKYKTDHDISSEDESDYYVQSLPDGYIKSKIDKMNGIINLSVKCISRDEESGLLKSNVNCKIEQLKKIAEDLLNILNMSKLWLNSGKEVCQQILYKR